MSPKATVDDIEARERWASLRAGGHASAGLEIPTSPTSVQTAAGPVRFALGPGNEPRILLPLPHGAKLARLLTTPALYIGDVVYDEGSKTQRFLDLICLSAELEPVFAEVADEMLDRIRRGASCVDACRSTLEDFRSLLLAPAQHRVRSETLIGLLGELLLLDRLLNSDRDAWRAWRGPLGERHDFRARERAIEVKSTSRTGSTRIFISAIDQLVPPVDGVLHLLHLVLEPVHGGDVSIGSLVTSVLSKASEPREIVNRLSAVDCTDPDGPEWNRTMFRLEREAIYLVDNDFPRLVPHTFGPAGVPVGITSINYEVDLSCAAANLIEPKESALVLTGLLACLSRN